MLSEFENLSLGGTNAASNHGDPFTHTELTPEQQKTLIDIRRRKTELLLEIQVQFLANEVKIKTKTTIGKFKHANQKNLYKNSLV